MAPPLRNKTSSNCSQWDNIGLMDIVQKEAALEEIVWKGMKMWHIIFLTISGVLSLIIMICCCVKFRIPRTKQEIEADYIRRKILRKFRKRLKAIQNQELDEMDLKKALDKIRAEFKSDTESLAQSEAGFSGATISSTGPGAGGPGAPGTYRRASQIQIDISLEDLRAQQLGFKGRFVLAFSRLCGRTKTKSDKVALTMDAEGEAQITVPEGAFKAKKNDKTKACPAASTSAVPLPAKSVKITPAVAAPTPTPKSLAPPKEKKPQKEKKSKVKDEKPEQSSMEVKSQHEPKKAKAPPTTSTPAPPPPAPDKKVAEKDKEKVDKKAAEKEKKEKEKQDKQKEKEEKEKQTKLKIENEKASKSQKEKDKKEKAEKDKQDKKKKAEDKPKK